jgi:hypothetical protein
MSISETVPRLRSPRVGGTRMPSPKE